MRILDLFSGAGGSAAGYARAGFRPIGVDSDIKALRRYPYPAVCMDAMTAVHGGIDLEQFRVIHASPPCQAYSVTRSTHNVDHPELLEDVHAALVAWASRAEPAQPRIWIIENVKGATLPGAEIPPLEICGAAQTAHDPDTGLRLRLKRHRLFWCNVWLWADQCVCDRTPIGGVYAGGKVDHTRARTVRRGGYTPAKDVRADLMGIDWMNQRQLSQAIPPAYTQYLGSQIMEHLHYTERRAPGSGP